MADALYTVYKENMIGSGTRIDLDTDVIKARLVTSSYTFSAAHTTMTDIGTGVGTDQTLTVTALTGGKVIASDSTWASVAAGSTITAVVLYKFVTNDAGSTPIAYIDSITDTPTNGGNIVIDWDGTNGIFYL